MGTYLWKINKRKLNKTNLALYSNFIKKNYKVNSNNNFNKIWKWSVDNPKIFWKSIWDFTKVKGIKKEKSYLSKILFKSKFLINSKLNFAENLLSKNDSTKAITFLSENGFREERSWLQLNNNVSKIINFFKKIKLNRS